MKRKLKYKEVEDPNNSTKLSLILGVCLILALLFIGYLLFNQYYDARKKFDSRFGEESPRDFYDGPSFSDMMDACIDKEVGNSCQVFQNNETKIGNCSLSRSNDVICVVPMNQ